MKAWLLLLAAMTFAAIGANAQSQSDQDPNQTQNSSAKAHSKDQNPDSDINDKDQPSVVKRTEKAAAVLQEIEGTPEKGIPSKLLNDARCVAVIPSMFKAGIGIGGRYGRGVATCRTRRGWSAPAPIMIAGGSWGLQFGAEAVDIVMLVMNQQGMDHLLASKFKIGADASAAAGPIGRDVAASTDWKMHSEVLTYSRARGVFAGATLNGAAIKQDQDGTRLLYGRDIPFRTILTGHVRTPGSARALETTLRKYSPTTPARAAKSTSGL